MWSIETHLSNVIPTCGQYSWTNMFEMIQDDGLLDYLKIKSKLMHNIQLIASNSWWTIYTRVLRIEKLN